MTLHEFGEHEGALYIAMELLPGETLRKRLSRGPIAEAEALAIARDVAYGLRAAHEAGIVHRDVKPENIVLVPDPDRGVIAKLLDFGVARLDASPDATQTAVGVVVGTPGYIAPETALHGRTDDPRGLVEEMTADVRWALRRQSSLNVGIVQDGAHEMWNRTREGLASLRNEGLLKNWLEGIDRYHLLERLGGALQVIEPHDDAERKRTLDGWRVRFDEDDATIDDVETFLAQRQSELALDAEKDAVLSDHLRFIKNQREGSMSTATVPSE